MNFDPGYQDPDDGQVDDNLRTISRKDLKQFKADRKERDELKAQLAERDRQAAFSSVPADHPAADVFRRGYDGELTPEAVNTAWQAIAGSPPGQGQQQPTDPRATELDQLSQADQFTQGGGDLSDNQLAARNKELAALGQHDPRYDDKFREIMERYGSPMKHQ